jgi:nanoRNase/pAp phosphatase (c-di-AMP/oligoRNAs hydrolase)
VSEADFEAAAFLLPQADADLLDRVEMPSQSAETVDVLGRAIRNRDVRGEALTACVGRLRDRDALAQAADRLLEMKGIRVTVVYGIIDDTVYVSGRARGATVDLGETMRTALGSVGSAGGHADMAGAQLPLGILGDADGEASADSLVGIVDDIVADRLFDALEDAPSVPTAPPEEFALEFPPEWYSSGDADRPPEESE